MWKGDLNSSGSRKMLDLVLKKRLFFSILAGEAWVAPAPRTFSLNRRKFSFTHGNRWVNHEICNTLATGPALSWRHPSLKETSRCCGPWSKTLRTLTQCYASRSQAHLDSVLCTLIPGASPQFKRSALVLAHLDPRRFPPWFSAAHLNPGCCTSRPL